jgi:hypothetical protein
VTGPALAELRQLTPDLLPASIRSRITVDPRSGCWLATGGLDKDGYGRYRGRGLHRVVWEHLVGTVPRGLVLDHVVARGCVSRACCRPACLEPVTHRVNVLRGSSFAAVNAAKTNCGRCGAPYSPANTYRHRGRRDCRCCIRRRVREYQARQKTARRADLARAA